MARENLREIREYAVGELLTAGTVNALVENAQHEHRPEQGIYAGGSPYRRAKDQPVWLYTDTEIPAYSLLGVCLDAAWDDPSTASGQQLGLEGSGCGSLIAIYTNDSVVLTAGSRHQVRPVGTDPVLIQVTGSLPTVGSPCGPDLDAWGVTADRQGFVCISEPDSDGRIWIIRAPELKAVVGEVTTAPAAYDEGTETPGVGELKVQFLDSMGALADAKDPATGATPWFQTFYNFSPTAPEVGDKVLPTSTLGIGLAIAASSGSSGTTTAMVLLTGSGGFAQGDLLWPDPDGWHSGQTMTWVDGVRAAGDSCLLRFVDWDEEDNGLVVGECRRTYGPCQYTRFSSGESSGIPHYVVDIGEQTFLASCDVDVDKGDTGVFDLYNEDRTPSGLSVEALCLAAAYVAGTSGDPAWAIVTRVRSGLWLASPWECLES